MKRKKKEIRVYSILQINGDGSVDLACCYSDYDVAEKICKRLNRIYTQEYYITDTILDFDYQKRRMV